MNKDSNLLSFYMPYSLISFRLKKKKKLECLISLALIIYPVIMREKVLNFFADVNA